MSRPSNLLNTLEFNDYLKKNLKETIKNFVCFSPYIKLSALEWVAKNLRTDVHVDLICRMRPDDLIRGATDIEIYEFCKAHNWKIGIKSNLHAKVYINDDENVLIGSNNLTNSGLGLIENSNLELGISFVPNIKDKAKLESLFSGVSWLDDETIEKMKNYLEVTDKTISNKKNIYDWPDEWFKFKEIEYSFLSTDFPDMYPNEEDKELLTTFFQVASTDNIQTEFLRSDVYKWVIKILKESNKDFKSFGWLTSKIHDVLIDVPLPYRSQIKEICEFLINWIETYSSEIEITQHAKTKSLKLKI